MPLDPEKTPKGFPSQNWPQVLSTFFKNRHNYKKNYQLELDPLGSGIMHWWEELKTSVHFGGPTGIYTFIVMVTWWSSLLKGRPDNELANYLRTLEDVDRVLLSAIRNTTNQSPASSPTERSPMVPPVLAPPAPQPRGSKRSISVGPSSRKRLRS